MSRRPTPTSGKLKMIQDHERNRAERARRGEEKRRKKEKEKRRVEIDLDGSDMEEMVSQSSSQFEVEKICDKRFVKGEAEYNIKWKNYD